MLAAAFDFHQITVRHDLKLIITGGYEEAALARDTTARIFQEPHISLPGNRRQPKVKCQISDVIFPPKPIILDALKFATTYLRVIKGFNTKALIIDKVEFSTLSRQGFPCVHLSTELTKRKQIQSK